MNSKRKYRFSNLYSIRKNGKKILTRHHWLSNVPGHDYHVTKHGKVYKRLDNNYRWIRISTYSDGKPDSYLKCKIDCKSWLLHRLIATVYLPNPNGLPLVMHLNNNKRDCRVHNLKWGTELENMLQAWFDGCFKVPNKIVYYRDVHNLYNQGLSIKEIANIVPIHISSIRRILKNDGLIRHISKFKGYDK